MPSTLPDAHRVPSGLLDSHAAEIHVALRSHGTAGDDPDVLAEQLGTFNDGCNTTCENVQAAGYLPPDSEITLSPMLDFNEGFPVIEDTESRLTREGDGLTLTANTHGLTPGAYTVWWAVFNNPEYCVGGCNGEDFGNYKETPMAVDAAMAEF